MRPKALAVNAAAALVVLGCAGNTPTDLGVRDERLAACPSSPNCVSSDARSEPHAIAPLAIEGSAEDSWQRAREAVLALPRTRIVVDEPSYLRAECTSALMRYVDDLELDLRPAAGEIAVRSASRVGYGDMGVNRARIETLRAALAAR